MKYLLDTSWAIHYLRGEEKVIGKLLELEKEGLAISIITLAELYEGIYRSTDPTKDEQALRKFLSGVSVLGVNEKICKLFGRKRAKLHKKGTPIGDFDLLIASTCLHHDLVLLTGNIKDFERIENLKIVTV